jgi:hypothetical protein
MEVTEDTSYDDKSTLNDNASSNIKSMVVTEETTHDYISPLRMMRRGTYKP